MKLKQLRIVNLASIAKAELDFTAEPLKSAPVFLLCGETGVGKTTILDAICLALYGRTPRFCDNRDDRSAVVGDLAYNNLRQLVRRGCTSAAAVVVLEGNDGRTYEASWSVDAIARGRNKGRLNKDVWKWRDCAPGGATYALESELMGPEYNLRTRTLGGVVGAAIGLDFDQFCRTTMLAQGQFTKFLLSGEDEKALILEKLTNTERFAAIGKRIKESYDAAEQDVKAKERELEARKGLSGEARADILLRLRTGQAEAEEIRGQVDALAAKIGWIASGEALKAEMARAEQDLAAAREVLAQADFAAKARDVRDWDATHEVHESVRTGAAAEAEERSAEARIRAARADFAALRGGARWLQERGRELAEERDRLRARLDAEEVRAGMHGACASIVQNLVDAREAERDAAACERRRAEAEAERGGLEAKAGELAAGLAEAKERARAKAGEIAEAEARRDALDIGRVRAERESVQTRRDRAVAAGAQARTLAEEEANLSRREAELEAGRAALEEQKGRLPDLARKAADAAERKNRAEADRDRQRALVTDGVRQLVASLHVGETCPVCGNRIQKLAVADSFQALFDELSGKCLERRREWEEAVAAENEVRTAVALDERRRAQEAGRLAADRAALAERRKGLEEAAAGTGLAAATAAAFAACVETCDRTLGSLDATIRAYEAASGEILRLSHEKEVLVEAENRAQRGLNENRAAIDVSRTRSEGHARQAMDRRRMAEAKLAAARGAIVWTDWEAAWRADAAGFEENLKAAAKAYGDLKAETEGCERRLADLRVQHDAAQAGLARVEAVFPAWRADAAGAVAERGALQDEVADFIGSAASLKKELDAARERLEKSRAACRAFLAAHPGYDEARLAALAGMKIDPVRREVERANNRVATLQGELGKAKGDLEGHVARRPADLGAEDTRETLEAERRERNLRAGEVLQLVGGLRKQLEDDDACVAERARMEAGLADARRVRDSWKPLHDLYGDADGKKIRRVIQAYVLANVLAKANGYLDRLCPDRYRLSSVGLTLTVLDAFEGGAERPAKTLSGGEGFLVSLALALGLANMNETGLAVDMLFIDEGFGSLSREHLEKAVDALESLNQICGSRRIGIISHIDRLRERIRTHVEVTRRGHEPSTVGVR